MGWEEKWKQEAQEEYWNKPSPRVLELIQWWRKMGLIKAADIGCGIGRHSIALAQAGYSVTALDSSKTALEKLGEKINGLDIELVQGDYLEKLLAPKAFDIVISYNVIYHNGFKDFQKAIENIHNYLKPGGYFFMTCPTREDDKYGSGREVAPHTYESLNSVHPGDIHYFADEKDLENLLQGFKILNLEKEEHFWDNEGSRQFSSYW